MEVSPLEENQPEKLGVNLLFFENFPDKVREKCIWMVCLLCKSLFEIYFCLQEIGRCLRSIAPTSKKEISQRYAWEYYG